MSNDWQLDLPLLDTKLLEQKEAQRAESLAQKEDHRTKGEET